MNKYSSKAIKTAATVGMSLAMVLSNVAPVLAAYTPQTVETTTSAENYIAKFNDALTDASLSLESIKFGETINFAGEAKLEVATFTDADGIKVDTGLITDMKKVANLVTYKGDSYNTADYVLGLEAALTAMVQKASVDESLVGKITTLLADVAKYKDDMLTISGYNDALELKKDIDKYEKYEGNLPEDPTTGGSTNNLYSASQYTDAKTDLLDAIESFQSDNYGETLDKYLTQLEKVYNKFVEVEGDAGITKAKVDAIVKKIKNGGLVAGYNGVTADALTKENYNVFKEDDAVVELMEQFTEGYDDLESVKDALSAKNEYTTALIKDKAKYDGKTKETLKSFINGRNFSDVVAETTDEMFAIIKDYKENVIDVILTLDSKLVGST